MGEKRVDPESVCMQEEGILINCESKEGEAGNQ